MKNEALIDELRSQSKSVHSEMCDPGVSLVMGEGSLESDLMIVGEAPGAQEDRQQRPFVGAAGQLLERELLRAGMDRSEVYITNAVKCRPISTQDGHTRNRPPTVKERRAWQGVLLREIEIIRPRVIVCLGAVPASILIHPKFAIRSERGKWFDGPSGARVIAAYHPAYLLRGQQYGNADILIEFRRDLDAVRAELARKPSVEVGG